MKESWLKYRPNFDAPRDQQAAGALPPDDAPLIAFLKETLGETRLAELRAKYGSGNPESYERQQAAAQQEARAASILAHIGPSTPFISNLTVALFSDDFQSAARAVVSLVKLVRSDGDRTAAETTEWSSSDVERSIRDYLATLPAGGSRRRKTQFCFAAPPLLSKLQLRLLQHSRNGGKLGDFCAEEGFQPAFGTRQRVWTIYAAVAHGVDLPPTLLDFRRGVWAGPTEITDAQAATVVAVLKRATEKLLPLIDEARQRIEPKRHVEVTPAMREAWVKAGKASAASKAARRAEEKRLLTPAEREARAEAVIQKELDRAARTRERDRKRKASRHEPL